MKWRTLLFFDKNLMRHCQCLLKFCQKKRVFSISKKQKIKGERYRNFHANYYNFLFPHGMKYNRFSVLMQNFHRSLSFETILYFFMFIVFFLFPFQLHFFSVAIYNYFSLYCLSEFFKPFYISGSSCS